MHPHCELTGLARGLHHLTSEQNLKVIYEPDEIVFFYLVSQHNSGYYSLVCIHVLFTCIGENVGCLNKSQKNK